jgi:DNA adenine methylase
LPPKTTLSIPKGGPRPFLKWVGGKRQLLPRLLEQFEAAGKVSRYHEPFVGGGALFFELVRREWINPAEAILSDANPNLIDTYRGVRNDVDEVIDILKRYKQSHDEGHYYQVRAEEPRKLTEKAARIIYLNKTCYNGLYRENQQGKFNSPFGRYDNPTICDEVNLRAVAKALKKATLHCRPFQEIVNEAKKGDFVYFDPPYHPLSNTANFTAYERNGFGTAAQEELAKVFRKLAKRRVKTVLSNSWSNDTRTWYQEFGPMEVRANRAVNSRPDRRGKVSELLVSSF